MKTGIIAICSAVLLTLSITANAGDKTSTLLVGYYDFGFPIASELLGHEWYQWNDTGSPNPKASYNVKVILYREVSLDSVKKKFRIVKTRGKEQDFRYIKYKDAIAYLNKRIKEYSKEAGKDRLYRDGVRDLKKFRARIYMEMGR